MKAFYHSSGIGTTLNLFQLTLTTHTAFPEHTHSSSCSKCLIAGLSLIVTSLETDLCVYFLSHKSLDGSLLIV